MEIGNFIKATGNFLSAKDVTAKPKAVFVITSEGQMVKSEKFQTEKLQLEGEFDKEPKLFELSKTNARYVSQQLGSDTKKWIGKTLSLETYKTKTSDGKLTDAININGVK